MDIFIVGAQATANTVDGDITTADHHNFFALRIRIAAGIYLPQICKPRNKSLIILAFSLDTHLGAVLRADCNKNRVELIFKPGKCQILSDGLTVVDDDPHFLNLLDFTLQNIAR